MNLYKIVFAHYAPRDREDGIKCLVLADNDEQVYEWIKSEPETKEGRIYVDWDDYSNLRFDGDTDTLVDEEGNPSEGYWEDEDGNPETHKERILRLKGEIDDDKELSDLYYGVTVYGWELVKENVTSGYTELLETGLVIKIL